MTEITGRRTRSAGAAGGDEVTRNETSPAGRRGAVRSNSDLFTWTSRKRADALDTPQLVGDAPTNFQRLLDATRRGDLMRGHAQAIMLASFVGASVLIGDSTAWASVPPDSPAATPLSTVPAPAPAPTPDVSSPAPDASVSLGYTGYISNAITPDSTCRFNTGGDYVHVSSTAPEASGHGWWINLGCRASTATVTVQLQEYYSDGSWRNNGTIGRSTVAAGGGSGSRATGRAGCTTRSLTGWRSIVDVDITGLIDDPTKLTTPTVNILCRR